MQQRTNDARFWLSPNYGAGKAPVFQTAESDENRCIRRCIGLDGRNVQSTEQIVGVEAMATSIRRLQKMSFSAWQGQWLVFRDNRFRSTACRPYTYRVGEVAERLKAAVC